MNKEKPVKTRKEKAESKHINIKALLDPFSKDPYLNKPKNTKAKKSVKKTLKPKEGSLRNALEKLQNNGLEH